MNEPINTELKRKPDGTFAEGTAPGPGRPKGKTMKEFAREYFMLKSDVEKIEYIENLEKVKPGFAWTMGEGNPKQDTDVTSDGEKIMGVVILPTRENTLETSTETGDSTS